MRRLYTSLSAKQQPVKSEIKAFVDRLYVLFPHYFDFSDLQWRRERTMRPRLTLAVLASFLSSHVLAQSERTATIHEVQPVASDVVHTIWLNGPANTAKAQWVPKVSSDTSAQCTTHDDAFTGYTTNGAYCEPSSTTLDDAAHLLVHSGRVALVVDAAGAHGATSSRNLFPKLGSLHSVDERRCP